MDLSKQLSSMILDDTQQASGKSFDPSSLALGDELLDMKVAYIQHGAKVVLNITDIQAQLARNGNSMLVVTLEVQLPADSKTVVPPIKDYITLPMSTDSAFTIIKKRERLDNFLLSIELSIAEFREYAASFLEADFSAFTDKLVVCTVSKTAFEGQPQNRIHSWEGPYAQVK